MSYHWINLFNMVEMQDGFASVEEAKADCVRTYVEIQNGLALHVGIGSDDGPICEGSIREGGWINGEPKLSSTQTQVGRDYRAMTKGKT